MHCVWVCKAYAYMIAKMAISVREFRTSKICSFHRVLVLSLSEGLMVSFGLKPHGAFLVH